MTIDEVKRLHYMDEVTWNDPDNEQCSKVITIKDILIDDEDEMIEIIDIDGYTHYVLAQELS